MFGQGALGDLALGEPSGYIAAPAAGTGTFTIGSVPATLIHRYPINAAAGAYALSPGSVTFTVVRNLKIQAAPGAFVLSPRTITGGVHHLMNTAPGAYALAGVNAGLRQVLGAQAAAYSIASVGVTFNHLRKLPAASGAFTLAGNPATIRWNHKLSPAAGGYTVSGHATLTFTRGVFPAPATFALTGKPATLLWDHLLQAPQARAVPIYVLGRGTAQLYPIITPLRTLSTSPGAYRLFPKASDYTTNGDVGVRNLDADPGAFTLSGAAQLLVDRILRPSAGSIIVSSNLSVFGRKHLLSGSAGAYAINTVPAALLVKRDLYVGTGAFTLTPYMVQSPKEYLRTAASTYTVAPLTASLLHARQLNAATGEFHLFPVQSILAAPGAFTLRGSVAKMQHVRPFNAVAGSFAITGSNATVTVSVEFSPVTAAYRVGSKGAELTYTRRIGTSSAAYALNAQGAELVHTRVITAQAGAFAVVGNPAGSVRGFSLNVSAGAFGVVGNPVEWLETPALALIYPSSLAEAEIDLTISTSIELTFDTTTLASLEASDGDG